MAKLLCKVLTHTHTHTYACTHARTHTHTCTHTIRFQMDLLTHHTLKTKLSQKMAHDTPCYTQRIYMRLMTHECHFGTCVLVWHIMFTSTCKIANCVCHFDTISVSNSTNMPNWHTSFSLLCTCSLVMHWWAEPQRHTVAVCASVYTCCMSVSVCTSQHTTCPLTPPPLLTWNPDWVCMHVCVCVVCICACVSPTSTSIHAGIVGVSHQYLKWYSHLVQYLTLCGCPVNLHGHFWRLFTQSTSGLHRYNLKMLCVSCGVNTLDAAKKIKKLWILPKLKYLV